MIRIADEKCFLVQQGAIDVGQNVFVVLPFSVLSDEKSWFYLFLTLSISIIMTLGLTISQTARLF